MIRLQLLLALFFPAALSAESVSGMTGSLALATALAASLAVVALVCTVRSQVGPSSASVRIRGIALRECARHAAFLRLRDPGAPGRPRTRAPSPSSKAA